MQPLNSVGDKIMGIYSDILLTADFDRTITAADGSIPQKNLDAISYFMENGGTFTVNTGRNLPVSVNNILDVVPMNAPFLFADGCGAYDWKEGRLVEHTDFPVDIAEISAELTEKYPYITQEIQCITKHFRPGYDEGWERFNRDNRCSAWDYAPVSQIDQPVLRLVLRARFSLDNVFYGYDAKGLYASTEEENAAFQQMLNDIEMRYGDKIGVTRDSKWVSTVHTKGRSKLTIARKLQQLLDKKVLVCIGDARNDLPMLEGADYAFCPSDGAVADRFPNVCPCSEGSIADLIYNKLSPILTER